MAGFIADGPHACDVIRIGEAAAVVHEDDDLLPISRRSCYDAEPHLEYDAISVRECCHERVITVPRDRSVKRDTRVVR